MVQRGNTGGQSESGYGTEISHLTHDKYLERFGEEFGKTIPGIFTDEPSLADTHSAFGADRSWIPWTYGFAEYFREKNGYDPVDKIPLFFFEEKAVRKYGMIIGMRLHYVLVKTIPNRLLYGAESII